MSFVEYVKQVWKAGRSGGTPWSPDRLNHMEDGIKSCSDGISELNSNLTNNICTNLLNPTLETSSLNGITCTNNGDGTYTFNGTATSAATFVVQPTMLIAEKYSQKDLWLTGCPGTGSISTYWLQFWSNIQEPARDFGSGSKVYIIKGTPKDTNVAIIIETGFKATNLIFKPMLTTNLNATYNDFVSYTGNTGRLNADVALLKNNLNELLVSYYKSEPTLTLKKGTYWIFINKTQYSQSSIWAISSNQQPVAVANPSNEQMSMEVNNDIMTITWKNASYAVVSVLKAY